ncbi:MAG: GAF domain-containing protein, partial [Alphaproteobacteria bacterium]|nr:GAF domain-containing protein [Alphaproteobacteria bacterium]
MPAPLPPSETTRLAALRSYGILDTEAEEAFDRIVALAADFLATPIAAISLVDEARQWFKAKLGLAIDETPRDIAFCAHSILQTGVLVVEDARRSPIFADNPLVTGPTGIRAYAGAPLVTPDGQALGTLCVIDTRPRRFSRRQRRQLGRLAAMVMAELELRRA